MKINLCNHTDNLYTIEHVDIYTLSFLSLHLEDNRWLNELFFYNNLKLLDDETSGDKILKDC